MEMWMVERTVKLFECDICGEVGTRYTMLYEDGSQVMDRCVKHNKKQEALRVEKGTFTLAGAGKSTFAVSSDADIRLAQAKHKQQK